MCTWLELEGELYSIKELHDKMVEEANGTETYTRRWMKTKLLEKYGDRIFFSEMNGKSDIVCFRDTAEMLINEKWYHDKNENCEDDEAKRILELAAKIILGQIRLTEFDVANYPSNDIITNIEKGKNWVPSYLRHFMEALI